MNSQKRFLQTMRYSNIDRAPLFEEGIREGVIDQWRQQGLPEGKELSELFTFDRREEVSIDLLPRIDFGKLAKQEDRLVAWREHLELQAEDRMPEDWQKHAPAWRVRDYPLMLMVHWGFFESIGIEDGATFVESIYLMVDEPDFIKETLMILGEFAARLVERVLSQTSIDAAIFSEPIGGDHGALISSDTYREFALPGYQPILEVLKKQNVETIIWRTYANTRALLRPAVEAGMNCLWACECNPQAMDYLSIRKEFGADLRLIGGIDLDVMRDGKESIRQELERVLPPLLAQGGYTPLADGRVREDIAFKDYVYYRKIFEEIVRG